MDALTQQPGSGGDLGGSAVLSFLSLSSYYSVFPVTHQHVHTPLNPNLHNERLFSDVFAASDRYASRFLQSLHVIKPILLFNICFSLNLFGLMRSNKLLHRKSQKY